MGGVNWWDGNNGVNPLNYAFCKWASIISKRGGNVNDYYVLK
jgi:hypothetical protein